MTGVGDFAGDDEDKSLLRSAPSPLDLASQPGSASSSRRSGINHLLRHLDHSLSGRRSTTRRPLSRPSSPLPLPDDPLADGAPPEWALLLIGCLLGLATGLCVAAFNRGVHVIHEWAWAGTPNEGAAWLRLQRLEDTWHRILLIPVTGGVVVGMMHGLLEIFDQIRQSRSSHRPSVDLLAGIFPLVKAIQAAVTLGTGCSLGPEGPSVDIGKSCANGCSEMMENNRERRIALVAAGAAAGIASGFNAAVAGCFFAIETVLRPLRAENSPPFTTAMIILASVIASTVSNVLLGQRPAFIVPTYELKSAAELPLYLILGMLCGAVSVVFSRLVAWFTKSFEYIKERFGLPVIVCPALGGFGAGLIALKYPGILYWGFTNVEEILHTGKSASAPGIWLLTQLVGAKVVATALCKGSGLVGGLYAPSLMIGAALGAVFGGSAGELINSAIPGNAAIAQPQAYALVGMAATLASVCSVPLTSVLLLFELTKDYRILLPLMGAVGLAIWVPSVANQSKESDLETRASSRGYASASSVEDKNESAWRQTEGGDNLELSVLETDYGSIHEDSFLDGLKVSQAMSKSYAKVLPTVTLKEAMKLMHDKKQNCVLVIDNDSFLEGILTLGDIRRRGETPCTPKGDSTSFDVNNCLVSSCFTRGFKFRGNDRGLLTCFPDTELTIAKQLMEAKGVKQLPVVKHSRDFRNERKRMPVAILRYESIGQCLSLNEAEDSSSKGHMQSAKMFFFLILPSLSPSSLKFSHSSIQHLPIPLALLMESRHPRRRSLASLPDGVLLMVAMHVASSSPKPFADIGNLKLSCRTFRQVTSDRMVERCIAVDREYDRMTWGGLERKERYIAFVRRCSDAGNSEANCILGVQLLSTHGERYAGISRLLRAKESGHEAAAYILGMLYFQEVDTRVVGVELLNMLATGCSSCNCIRGTEPGCLILHCRRKTTSLSWCKIFWKLPNDMSLSSCANAACGRVIGSAWMPDDELRRTFCSPLCREELERSGASYQQRNEDLQEITVIQ